MKRGIRLLLTRLLCAFVILYLVLDIWGALLLSRSSKPVSPRVSKTLRVFPPIQDRWKSTTEVMADFPPKGSPLTYEELERLRKLIWIANSGAPDEWEGSDWLPVSYRSIRYLRYAYPQLVYMGTSDGRIRLSGVETVVGSKPPYRWLIPITECIRYFSGE
jgi:hypothetical protein